MELEAVFCRNSIDMVNDVRVRIMQTVLINEQYNLFKFVNINKTEYISVHI